MFLYKTQEPIIVSLELSIKQFFLLQSKVFYLGKMFHQLYYCLHQSNCCLLLVRANMGCLVSPIVSNIFMTHLEQKAFNIRDHSENIPGGVGGGMAWGG